MFDLVIKTSLSQFGAWVLFLAPLLLASSFLPVQTMGGRGDSSVNWVLTTLMRDPEGVSICTVVTMPFGPLTSHV